MSRQFPLFCWNGGPVQGTWAEREGDELFIPMVNPRAACFRAVAALPDDPVEFLLECQAWWDWLELAGPDEITRHPQDGHRLVGPLERRGDRIPFPRRPLYPPAKPAAPQALYSGELVVPSLQLGMGVLGLPGRLNRYDPPQGSYGPRTPKPEIEPKGQGRPAREPDPPPREP